MKDNNVVAFYCSNCHETVLNCEHNFEQLHEKGLCAECLKKQNKPTISKTESVDNYLCKWQKLKEWGMSFLKDCDIILDKSKKDSYLYNSALHHKRILTIMLAKMQELEGEDE